MRILSTTGQIALIACLLFQQAPASGSSKCSSIFQIDSDLTVKARSTVSDHNFMTQRGIESYAEHFPGLTSILSKPGVRWLDAGGGEGLAATQFFDQMLMTGASVTLVSYKINRDLSDYKALRALQGRYFEDIPNKELSNRQFDVITDLYGVLSYSPNLSQNLNRYLNELLAPGMPLFIVTGQWGNRIIKNGQSMTIVDWLKTIPGLSVEIPFPQKSSTTIILRKTKDDVLIIPTVELLASYDNSVPPSREFIEKP